MPARIASERCDTLWCSSPCPVAEQRYDHSTLTVSGPKNGVPPPAAVAEEYGGDPAIPADVARAYSEQSYVLEARQGAAAGCEDGFASQDQGE